MTTTLNPKLNDRYKEAIKSLEKVNNEIFYNDLKERFIQREETLNRNNKELGESIDKLKKRLNHLPISLTGQLKDEVIMPQFYEVNNVLERIEMNSIQLDEMLIKWTEDHLREIEEFRTFLEGLKSSYQDGIETNSAKLENILLELETIKELLNQHKLQLASFQQKVQRLSQHHDLCIKNINAAILRNEEQQKAWQQEWREYLQVQENQDKSWQNEWKAFLTAQEEQQKSWEAEWRDFLKKQDEQQKLSIKEQDIRNTLSKRVFYSLIIGEISIIGLIIWLMAL